MFIPRTGVTGLEHLHDGPPYGKPPGYGRLSAQEGWPICFERWPSGCTCLDDHPMALVYVRWPTVAPDGRTVARVHRDRCNQAAELLDARVIGWYLDQGSSEAELRPGIDAMLDRLALVAAKHDLWRTKPVDYVIVSQADQLARSIATWQRINEAVATAGARIVLAGEVFS